MSSDQQLMVTVILHHDQSKTLDEIMAHLKKTGFYRDFPPEGSEIISWVVAMSYGFIIQLRMAPAALRNLNRFIEQKAWGACWPVAGPGWRRPFWRRSAPFRSIIPRKRGCMYCWRC